MVETKTGRARSFGLTLKDQLQRARQLWREYHADEAADFQVRAGEIEDEITAHLRQRQLTDADNQRLLDGIGLQHDRGNLLRFLHEPHVEPTNNRGERAIRSSVIIRRVSHGSKNEREAEAFASFKTVVESGVKKGVASTIDMLENLFRSKPRAGPSPP